MLIYCTKNDPRYETVRRGIPLNADDLFRLPNGTVKYGISVEIIAFPAEQWNCDNFLNGKIIGEYICDEILTFPYSDETGYPTPAYDGDPSFCSTGPGYWITNDQLEQTCLTYEELETYGHGKTLFGWHIANFRLYDKPLSLGDIRYPCKHIIGEDMACLSCTNSVARAIPYSMSGYECKISGMIPLKKAPQSWREIVVSDDPPCSGYAPYANGYPKCSGYYPKKCRKCTSWIYYHKTFQEGE